MSTAGRCASTRPSRRLPSRLTPPAALRHTSFMLHPRTNTGTHVVFQRSRVSVLVMLIPSPGVAHAQTSSFSLFRGLPSWAGLVAGMGMSATFSRLPGPAARRSPLSYALLRCVRCRSPDCRVCWRTGSSRSCVMPTTQIPVMAGLASAGRASPAASRRGRDGCNLILIFKTIAFIPGAPAHRRHERVEDRRLVACATLGIVTTYINKADRLAVAFLHDTFSTRTSRCRSTR